MCISGIRESMPVDRIASQLFDLGLRVLDVFSVDAYDVYVISGVDGRVRDVVIFADGLPIDAFAKPSWFDNWARFTRKVNSGIADEDVHVEGVVFMAGKYFMERQFVLDMVEDSAENRRALLDSMDNVDRALCKVLEKKPAMEEDVRKFFPAEPLRPLDESMSLSVLKCEWIVRRDRVLGQFTTEPYIAKMLGRSFHYDFMKPLFENKDYDLVGTMVAHTRAALMLTNPAIFCFCASMGYSEELSDVDAHYALKIEVDEDLKSKHGLLYMFLPDMPLEPKAELVRKIAASREPQARLGQLNLQAKKLAVLGLSQVRPPMTAGMEVLRRIGYEEWWNYNVGRLETYSQAVERVSAERDMLPDELMYHGIPVLPVGQELFSPVPTFSDPRDYEAVHSVVVGVVKARQILDALARL